MSSEGYKATLEWGFWKFLKYLIRFSLTAWIASWVATRLFNLDIIVGNWLVVTHLANLWLFIPETAFIISSVYIYRWGRRAEKQDRYTRYKQHVQDLVKQSGVEVNKNEQ